MNKVTITPSALLAMTSAPIIGVGLGLLAASFIIKKKVG